MELKRGIWKEIIAGRRVCKKKKFIMHFCVVLKKKKIKFFQKYFPIVYMLRNFIFQLLNKHLT